MSNAGKVSAWVAGATAIVGTLLAVLTYGGAVMSAEVEHESRHTKVETAVLRIDKVVEEQNKVIQSQLAEGREMRIIILKKILEK